MRWPGLLQNTYFFKAKISEKTRKEIFPELRKRTGGMPANMYISLPYLPTKYYKKVWKIIIATNILNNCESNFVLFPQAITGKICIKTWVSLHLQSSKMNYLQIFLCF